MPGLAINMLGTRVYGGWNNEVWLLYHQCQHWRG